MIHIWDLRSNSININTLSARKYYFFFEFFFCTNIYFLDSAGVQRIRSGAKEYELYSCSKDKKALKWDLRFGKCINLKNLK